jgi:SGT1 protein.
MEDGSLLPFALQYMKQLREKEHNFNFPHDHHFQSQIDTFPNDSLSRLGEGNALIISLFCIDMPADVEVRDESNRKSLLFKLASVHSVIHSSIIPTYNKNYRHSWFVGGSGISFGLHCGDGDSGEREIPHLRAVVHYGPHPLDELFAIAMMMRISSDLLCYYNYNVAIECWDIDDGQIMLIEGANDLPFWVDDEIGVEAMAKRVYIVNGQIQLLPPCYIGNSYGSQESSGKYILTRKESLDALMDLMSIKSSQERDSKVLALNRAIQKRLDPFCKAISHAMDSTTQTIRQLLVEYLHTAAIVVPMQLALVLQQRPDLIPVAILTFCRRVSENGIAAAHNSACGKTASHDVIPFENLVFTKIMVPKILYVMLLTAAGQLPPPMKTPRHYKSVELNRIKRQCENGGMAYAHFRHAIEAGMRLSLGFEWIIFDDQTKVKGSISASRPLLCCSTEERLTKHTSRIDIEAGGDGKWIQSSWEVGPNDSTEEDNIAPLVKCPVWCPEILQGGICPISNPGKFITIHVSSMFLTAR